VAVGRSRCGFLVRGRGGSCPLAAGDSRLCLLRGAAASGADELTSAVWSLAGVRPTSDSDRTARSPPLSGSDASFSTSLSRAFRLKSDCASIAGAETAPRRQVATSQLSKQGLIEFLDPSCLGPALTRAMRVIMMVLAAR
jgi:hypothetical protein